VLRSDQVAALNLARRPLANLRPLRRVVAALWTAAALVLLVDAWVLVRHLTSSSSGRERMREIDTEIAQEVESLRQLERALREFDLDEQNRHVEFLNQKIAERTFPWSRLFEQLSSVLPEGVRLISLRPAINEEDESAARPGAARARRQVGAAPPKRWVQLQIAGEAETDDAILELVDALFRHPAFSGPNLHNESQDHAGYRFNLGVRYLPDLEATESEDTSAEQSTETAETAADTETERVGGVSGGAR
jgi:Tfp pilus assembly protein PilN